MVMNNKLCRRHCSLPLVNSSVNLISKICAFMQCLILISTGDGQLYAAVSSFNHVSFFGLGSSYANCLCSWIYSNLLKPIWEYQKHNFWSLICFWYSATIPSTMPCFRSIVAGCQLHSTVFIFPEWTCLTEHNINHKLSNTKYKTTNN